VRAYIASGTAQGTAGAAAFHRAFEQQSARQPENVLALS